MSAVEHARAHLKRQFPSTNVLDAWLEPCVDYLTSTNSYPSTGPSDALCRDVEEQLLLSDLSGSVAPSLPVVLPSIASTGAATTSAKSTKIAVLKGSYLLQVVSLDDTSKPALDLLSTLEEQKAAEREAQIKAERTYNIDDVKDEQDDMLDAPRDFIRGKAARLVLSDGQTELVAFERRPVAGLGLQECKLGAKFLVTDAEMLNGLLLLSADNTNVLGYQIEEWESERYDLLKQTWQQRLAGGQQAVQA